MAIPVPWVAIPLTKRTPRLRTTPHPYTKTATFGLRLALRLFEKTNNDVTTSTVSNQLLHVRPPRAGGIAWSVWFVTKGFFGS